MADYPSSTVRGIKFKSLQMVDKSTAESGKMTAVKYGAQKWAFNLTHAPMKTAEMRVLSAFWENYGTHTAFTVSLPDKAVNYGAVTGTPNVNGAFSAGSTSIPIEGLVSGTSDVFLASAMINFSSHSKAYKITGTVSANDNDAIEKADGTGVLLKADGSGDSLLMARANQSFVEVFPALVESVADDTIKYGSTQTFTMKFTNKPFKYSVAPPDIYQISHTMKEHIS